MKSPIFVWIQYGTMILSLCWGFYEGRAASKNRSAKTKGKSADRGSFALIYAAISFGFAGGYTLSFMHLGEMNYLFPLIFIAGLVLAATGLYIRLQAIRILQKRFTHTIQIVDGHDIVRAGFYKYIRHPSYAGQILIMLGFGMMLSNWMSVLAFVVPIASAIMYRIHIEETMLIDHFGDRYRDYIKETKRFIPGVW